MKGASIYICVVVVSCIALFLTSSQLPVVAANHHIGYPSRMLSPTDDQTCPTPELRETVRSRITRDVRSLVRNYSVTTCKLGRYEDFPANSCGDIPANCPSDFYWIRVAGSEYPRRVYCTSNTQCCHGSEGKWMRIGFLNMTDPTQQCPYGWREVAEPIRSCRREHTLFVNNVTYSSQGMNFSRVCGRVIAYQYGTPEAFNNGQSIEQRYVDGVSITYGSPRQHIWTFAAAGVLGGARCPCNRANAGVVPVPSFVNDEYFCERGASVNAEGRFFPDNLLWDGEGCLGDSTCCSLNNPPWFCKELLQPTREEVELRILTWAASPQLLEREDTPIELIEIYVQ